MLLIQDQVGYSDYTSRALEQQEDMLLLLFETKKTNTLLGEIKEGLAAQTTAPQTLGNQLLALVEASGAKSMETYKGSGDYTNLLKNRKPHILQSKKTTTEACNTKQSSQFAREYCILHSMLRNLMSLLIKIISL